MSIQYGRLVDLNQTAIIRISALMHSFCAFLEANDGAEGSALLRRMSLLGFSCRDDIDVTLVSPRNYFLYTPLLPAAATGTVEERSIVEPVRKMLGKKVGCMAPLLLHTSKTFSFKGRNTHRKL